MDKHIDYQSYIGELTDERCPKCNSNLLLDKHGTKWCSFVNCTWSNEKELTEFIKSLSTTK